VLDIRDFHDRFFRLSSFVWCSRSFGFTVQKLRQNEEPVCYLFMQRKSFKKINLKTGKSFFKAID